MIKLLKSCMLMVLLLTISFSIAAQEKTVAMADMMRSNGRIYVVVAVMLTILAGLILYIVRLDRKITKLEKEN